MLDHVEEAAIHDASTWGDVHLAIQRHVSIDATGSEESLGKPTMNANSAKRIRSYWLGLAISYGLALTVATVADWPWPLVVLGVLILFIILQGRHYGQIGRKIHREPGSDAPAISLLASAFTAAAILIHGTSIAVWAGPLLGGVTAVVMYLVLAKYGRFYSPSSAGADRPSEQAIRDA